MKNVFLTLILLLGMYAYAQNETKPSKVFIRVYNLQGKKIAKGSNYTISETSLQFHKKDRLLDIPASEIGSIKTKRAAGNNLLVGAGTGATALGILGAATGNSGGIPSYTPAEGAATFAAVGAIAGAAVGGITLLFKNSETYPINGDAGNLRVFKDRVPHN